MKTRLRRLNARTHSSDAGRFIVVMNEASGRRNVYNLWLITADDPVTIGRELPLNMIRELIDEYNIELAKMWYTGSRRQALRALKIVSQRKLLST